MKASEERRNIPNLRLSSPKVKVELGSVKAQAVTLYVTDLTAVIVGVCQLQDGLRTMTSVVQYAFVVLVNPGGKGTRYSD